MSQTIITETIRDGFGVLTDVDSIVFADPTDTFGVRRNDTLAVVVAAGTPLVHVSTGVYRYVITDPAPNITYQYWIRAEYAGEVYDFEKEKSGSTAPPTPPPSPTIIAPAAYPRSCVTLSRFAYLVGEEECAVWGVNSGYTPVYGECADVLWSQYQRNEIMRYLATAQEMIENVTGYPLCPTYFEDEYHPLACSRRAALPVHTKWKRVLGVGVKVKTLLDADAPVDYDADPDGYLGYIEVTAADVTDPSEIHVYYQDSDREIEPATVTLVSDTAQIWIPRCRMVAADKLYTPQAGLRLNDDANFAAAVDVYRESLSTETQGEFVFAHRNTAGATCSGCGNLTCGEATADACLYVSNPLTGAVDALRGTYDGGEWTVNNPICYGGRPSGIRLNYVAGLDPLTLAAEQAILRLANALMPKTLCGCGPLVSLWERDNRVPDFIDPLRASNPFGPSDGAMEAYTFAKTIASRRLSIM